MQYRVAGSNGFGQGYPVRENAFVFSERLKTLASKTVWDLRHCAIGDEEASEVTKALLASTCVAERLSLSTNNIGLTGAQQFAKVLSLVDTITVINFNQNNIGDDGAYALAEVIPRAPALRMLYLAQNGIGDAGALHLIEAMCDSECKVVELDLSYNPLSDIGVQSILAVISGSERWKSKRLRLNGIQLQDGVRAALQQMSCYDPPPPAPTSWKASSQVLS